MEDPYLDCVCFHRPVGSVTSNPIRRSVRRDGENTCRANRRQDLRSTAPDGETAWTA